MLFDRKRWESKEPVVPPEAPKPKAKPKRKLWQRMLLKAANYIQKHGWVQGRRKNLETGEVCIMGALDAVQGGLFTPEVREMAQRKLAPGSVEPGYSIARFNDMKGTTKTTVLDRLRQVAKGR